MRNYSVKQQTYQDFNDSRKYPAKYQDGKDHKDQPKPSEREYWFPVAIDRYINDPRVKCLFYNENVHTVRIFDTYEPDNIIDANTYHQREKKTLRSTGEISTRHVNCTMVIFD